MKHLLLIIGLFFVLQPNPVFAQNQGELVVISPAEEQVMQGLVAITGTVTLLGFSSYELSFSYQDDSTQTWFPLYSSNLPVFEGELGTWDTTTLTDGDYNLRLRAFLLDGSSQETIVSGLRVRNYTVVPTSTPEPTPTTVMPLIVAPTGQLIAPVVATVTQSLPTPTNLPSNPAGLEAPSIYNAYWRGAAIVIFLFIGFGLALRLRRE